MDLYLLKGRLDHDSQGRCYILSAICSCAWIDRSTLFRGGRETSIQVTGVTKGPWYTSTS
jgi:hypothetical protein